MLNLPTELSQLHQSGRIPASQRVRDFIRQRMRVYTGAAKQGGRAVPTEWDKWLRFMFPMSVGSFAPHHAEFWEWVWGIRKGVRPRPFIGIWSRGGGKSTSAELACVAVGARHVRNYILYVRQTQSLADKSVENIASLLESDEVAAYYPSLSQRQIGKYGNVRGWRRSRLRTASGLTIDAIGLDTAARGIKTEENRPDFIILDDIDDKHDTPATTRKKEITITHNILPAQSNDAAVMGIQNLVIPDGIFSRLYNGKADYLSDRIVSGAHPAIRNFSYEYIDGRAVITGGEATWEGQPLEVCQEMIDTFGITAFLSECQHDVSDPEGGMFSHLNFDDITVARDDVPPLDRIVVWIDPAVTSTDKSDAMGIAVAGIDKNGIIYHLWSYEQVTTPLDVVKRGIMKAIEVKADWVGIETDMGGDLWRDEYYRAVDDLGVRGKAPAFRSAKAGGGYGSKVHRASLMLADYERGMIRHVEGTHKLLERALKRFPLTKPYDLVDATFWAWNDLRNRNKVTIMSMSEFMKNRG